MKKEDGEEKNKNLGAGMGDSAKVSAWNLLKTDKERAEKNQESLKKRGTISDLAFLKHTCLKI